MISCIGNIQSYIVKYKIVVLFYIILYSIPVKICCERGSAQPLLMSSTNKIVSNNNRTLELRLTW